MKHRLKGGRKQKRHENELTRNEKKKKKIHSQLQTFLLLNTFIKNVT